MSKQSIILVGPKQREYAQRCLASAPDGYTVTIQEPKRSLDQNKKMWAMLRDVRNAKPEGRHWADETWKCAFMHSLGHQCQFAEGLDGSGPFPTGFRTSSLKVAEMRDLIEIIYEYGSRHGVEWKETADAGYFTHTTERAA